ncbi:MAG TPA: PEP-CTERM sorting domain-containing protein, partial [Gemmataceae bacterium]|nr:PEP-CTERM sorting domain-containing protein [Gemmataceae bacterium]
QPTTLNRGGAGATLTANTLAVGHQMFDLGAADSVTNYYLTNATSTLNSSVSYLDVGNNSAATTTAGGTVTGSALVYNNSTMTLGADMSLRYSLQVESNSTVDAANHNITAQNILVGTEGLPANLINTHTVQAVNLVIGSGSSVTFDLNDVIDNLISLSGNSRLTVLQPSGQLTGLTFNGQNAGDLSLNDTSVLDLVFGSQTQPNWIFRWLDPAGGGSWDAYLASLIASGQIQITAPNGYSVLDQGGYTYIEGGFNQPTNAVPEPSTLVLASVAGGILVFMRWRVKQRRRVSRQTSEGFGASQL